MKEKSDWVAVSGVSPTAHSLHQKILMAGADGAAANSDTLARLMGFSRADKLRPYITELEAIGAVTVTKSGIPCRNKYLAVGPAPEGYCGPTSFADWSAAQDTEVVYYLQQQSGPVKIGYTAERLEIRARRLQQRYGPLKILASERGGQVLETSRHRQFAHLACSVGLAAGHTEWFRPANDLMEHVASLAPSAR